MTPFPGGDTGQAVGDADPFITREIEVPPSAPNPHETGGSSRREATGTAGKDTPVDSKPTLRDDIAGLSEPMRHMLWTIVQHKYGWGWVDNKTTTEALERRGLIKVDRSHSYWRSWTASITETGATIAAELWPVSPYNLGTYDHQPAGWTPRAGVQEAA